jgi:hypothetical protein
MSSHANPIETVRAGALVKNDPFLKIPALGEDVPWTSVLAESAPQKAMTGRANI